MFSATDNGRQTGYCSSGNGFFIVDNGRPEEQQGAWEFIKYFTSPDVQVDWNLETGYLPLYDEIYNAEGTKPNLMPPSAAASRAWVR